jgi:hypothetical protein
MLWHLDMEAAAASDTTKRNGAAQLSNCMLLKAGAWVLPLLPTAARTGIAERIICLPAVSPCLAQQLVSAGVRINCKQLVAAANSMVAGVEVWVQAQQQLGITTDIPAAYLRVCNVSTQDYIIQFKDSWVSNIIFCTVWALPASTAVAR